MSTKTHFITRTESKKVAAALKDAGYNVTPAQCNEYVCNVANFVDANNARKVTAIITRAL